MTTESHAVRLAAGFEDAFDSFEAARAVAAGYGSPAILERVRSASRAVVEGRAVHERDAVTFDLITYAVPVLTGLLLAAARSGGRLAVLDVGGSLGSSFRQNRRFLSQLGRSQWAVVEQPSFVDVGGREFADDQLSFHVTMEEAVAAVRPNVAILSSVCQYLDDPLAPIRALAATEVDVLVIDRTPVHDGPEDIPTLQHVPPSIYPATYPAWILARARLLAAVDSTFDVVDELPTLERAMKTSSGREFGWIGMVAVRRGGGA